MIRILVLKGLVTHYGAIKALKGISLEVRQGEIVALIGANGAGKTTTLNAISGLIPPSEGDIVFQGRSIGGVSPENIVKMGISHVPEGRRVFSQMTVMENLELGAYSRSDTREVKHDLDQVFQRFPQLADRRRQAAGTLSGGEQQMLAIGRALMARPRLLLMDEPSMGLAPKIVQTIFEIIRDINRAGTTILLVEQNAHLALATAGRAYVLETGAIALHGDTRELAKNERVREAYLGE
ncbi:MAG: ABC transporter ATP-binding protein [Bacillota bacterium]|jgi:branched-chain amino acid transport system ATP-binding protein